MKTQKEIKQINYIANVRMPTEKAHGVQIMNMCEAFAYAEVEVTLCVPTRKRLIKDDPYTYYSKLKTDFKIKKVPAIDFLHINLGKIGYKLFFWLEYVTFSISAVIWGIFHRGLMYGREEMILFLLGNLGKDVLWEAHTKKDTFFVRSYIKAGFKFVTISGGLKRHYMDLGASDDQVLVSHDAVLLSKFDGKEASKEQAREEISLELNKKYISYIGKMTTMGQSKGVKGLIDCLKALKKDIPELELLLVGVNDSERENLKNYLKQANIDSGVQLIGHQKQDILPNYLWASDVLLMNYPDTDHYRNYMSPLKLYEYMASFRPIVTTDLPSLREVVGDEDVFFYRDGDLEGMSYNIRVALDTNSSVVTKKVQNSYQKVSQMTWKNRARDILKWFRVSKI